MSLCFGLVTTSGCLASVPLACGGRGAGHGVTAATGFGGGGGGGGMGCATLTAGGGGGGCHGAGGMLGGGGGVGTRRLCLTGGVHTMEHGASLQACVGIIHACNACMHACMHACVHGTCVFACVRHAACQRAWDMRGTSVYT